jgi:hypothetical protein
MSANEVETGIPTLRLNFLALKNQEFSYHVYRKACSSPDEQRADENVYRYSLPVQIESEERADYWVSFTQRDGFQAYDCTPDTNRRLSVRYLCYLLTQSVQANLEADGYDLEEVTFRQGLDVIIAHHTKGTERIWIEPCYLAPAHKFGFLVDFHFRTNNKLSFDREVQRLSLSLDRQGYSNKDFYADKYRKIQEFLKGSGNSVFSAVFETDTLEINFDMEAVESSRLNPRRFVFANNNEHSIPFIGLDRFGPLTPINKPVRFALIYSTPDRPLVNELAAALMGRSKEVAFKGLQQLFQVHVGKSHLLEVPYLTPNNLQNMIGQLKQEQANTPDAILLPLVVMTKTDTETYRKLKYELLKENFAIQVVSTELIRNRATFKWSVANIALQIFAKAGGEPWRVIPTTHKCVIFGIGQAHDHDQQGTIRRYFSYLVCTDTTGLYRRSDVLGASTDETTYLSQLRQKILDVMTAELSAGYTRCVLHVPFKVKHKELKAIEEAIVTLKQQPENAQTQFVVLRINADTKYFGYADTNSLIPYESTFVRVSNSPSTYLVWFEGLQPGNPVVRKRPSGPVQIEFAWPRRIREAVEGYQNLSLKEAEERLMLPLREAEERQLLQDVLNLAGCNWRGFNSKLLPISIFYCQLIARHMRLFGDSSIQLGTMPNPWFL